MPYASWYFVQGNNEKRKKIGEGICGFSDYLQSGVEMIAFKRAIVYGIEMEMRKQQ